VLGQVYGGGTQLMIGGAEEPIHVATGSLEELLNASIDGTASTFATSTGAFDLSQSYDMENMSAVVPAEQFDALLYLRTVKPITLR
jgi:erythromycin esterase-like protein